MAETGLTFLDVTQFWVWANFMVYLAVFGVDRDSLFAPLDEVSPEAAKAARHQAKKWDRHHLERRLLLWLRRDIHERWYGRLLQRVRFYADVLLRE